MQLMYFRNAIFEACLLGTGIVKGPLNFNKRVHKWEKGQGQRKYVPYEKVSTSYRICICVGFSP